MLKNNVIRIISDIHGNNDRYLSIVKNSDYSVQIGDFGFDYSIMLSLNQCRHKIIGGNHENYDIIHNVPSYLGDFGQYILNGIHFFYVRGSISIDQVQRRAYEYKTGIKTWWVEEELNHQQGLKCLKLYELIKPSIVLSHDCPIVAKRFLKNSEQLMKSFGFPVDYCCNTEHLLQQMYEIYKPKLWIFGHFHQKLDIVYKGTRFVCLPEYGYVDLKCNSSKKFKLTFPNADV